EMQAEKITQEVLKGIDKYDVIIVNYANTDMIAHTGNMKATIKAAEIVDENLKPLIDLAKQDKCVLLITSDHGNAEQMIDLKTGEKLTEHTINPVPFYLVGEEYKLIKPKTEQEIKDIFKYPEGILSDISPTILELLNIKKPEKMTGKSLLGVVK
ncbi:alkaline phosphatase family protein, partial [Patescibacteria group bacterium]|nr:alkaline phosphatase family protein [Patescibacteria group bacterium]